MKILIVEDNPLMRDIIREMVSEFAEVITECEDGDEAFAAYQRNLPQWVLMDLQMRRVDGFSASQEIRSSYPNANICMVTDYGDARTRAHATEVGATAFVLKENLEELRTLLGPGI